MDVSHVIAPARAARAATPSVATPWALAGRVDARPIPPRNMDAEMLLARHFDRYGR